MIRLVLFDIDGTLIYSSAAGEKAFARVFAEQFGIADGTARLKFAGRTDPSVVRDFFTWHGIEASPANYALFFEHYLSCLEQMLGELPGGVHPGVRETIARLRELPNPPLIGLLTGNIRKGAEIKLRRFGLWEEFALGAFADDRMERDDIARDARELGAARLGGALRSEEILVIGDTPLDIACARAIGARVLAVATGSHSVEELSPFHPDHLLPTLAHDDVAAYCR